MTACEAQRGLGRAVRSGVSWGRGVSEQTMFRSVGVGEYRLAEGIGPGSGSFGRDSRARLAAAPLRMLPPRYIGLDNTEWMASR